MPKIGGNSKPHPAQDAWNEKGRMINPKQFSAISLTIRDLDRSLAWYREKFGFEKLYDDTPNSDGVVIGVQGVELILRQVADPAGCRTVDPARDICVPLFGFLVEASDLDRVEQEFPEDGDIIALDEHPKYRSRIIEDPDGHAIELVVERQCVRRA
jgi:catechol 2,3-dioxygenase-like lactoylglutathione lyase family enzyme